VKSRSPAIASLRASQWLHFCGLPLAGLGAENMRMGPDGWLRALVGGLIAAGCLGCAYGVNAAADRHTDRCSRKNPLVADPGRVAPAIACALLVALVALTLALAVGRVAPLACGLSLVCGLAYSLGGKRVPVLGLVLNAGIFAPLMAVLLVPGAVPPTWAHELAVFTALLIQNQLIHELADDEEDRAAGAGTTAQLLGGAGAVYLAVAVGLAVPLISPWLAPPRHALLAALLAALATGIAAAARRDPARARVLHRVTACVGGALLWLWARLPG
jgi:4-hydroxybenzoate polyprenyltransferase